MPLSTCFDCFSSTAREESTPLNNSINDDRDSQSSKRSYPRILTNLFATFVLAASGAVLFTQYDNRIKRDVRILTAGYLGLGASVRALIEANLPKNWTDTLQTIVSKSFFETYEILWNAYLNVSNPIGQEALLDAITAVGSFTVLGDWVLPFKLEKKDRSDRTLADLHLDKLSINPIIGPSFDNLRGQIYLKTALTITGIGLTVFSFLKETGLNVFYRSLGYFLAFQGIGFFLAQGGTALWKWSEDKDQKAPFKNQQSIREMSTRDLEKGSAVGEESSESDPDVLPTLSGDDLSSNVETPKKSSTSTLTKMFRTSAKIISSIGTEALAALYLIDKPYLYIPAGLIYGGIQYLAQRKFQVMTKDIYEAQCERNMIDETLSPFANSFPFTLPYLGPVLRPFLRLKTALKVEVVASVVFLFMFVGWFTYGDIESRGKDRWGIIVLVLSYILTELSAIPVEKYFQPEQKGTMARAINHLRYVFYHHPYLIAMAYLSLVQISEINDEALKLDSLPNYICGMIAIGLFGMNFALTRMRHVSCSGITTISPAVARMIWIRTVLFDRMNNRFGM